MPDVRSAWCGWQSSAKNVRPGRVAHRPQWSRCLPSRVRLCPAKHAIDACSPDLELAGNVSWADAFFSKFAHLRWID